MTTLWDDDLLQFARLLSEIVATQDVDIEVLCASMDLDPIDVNELFDRAHTHWEAAKAEHGLLDTNGRW